MKVFLHVFCFLFSFTTLHAEIEKVNFCKTLVEKIYGSSFHKTVPHRSIISQISSFKKDSYEQYFESNNLKLPNHASEIFNFSKDFRKNLQKQFDGVFHEIFYVLEVEKSSLSLKSFPISKLYALLDSLDFSFEQLNSLNKIADDIIKLRANDPNYHSIKSSIKARFHVLSGQIIEEQRSYLISSEILLSKKLNMNYDLLFKDYISTFIQLQKENRHPILRSLYEHLISISLEKYSRFIYREERNLNDVLSYYYFLQKSVVILKKFDFKNSISKEHIDYLIASSNDLLLYKLKSHFDNPELVLKTLNYIILKSSVSKEEILEEVDLKSNIENYFELLLRIKQIVPHKFWNLKKEERLKLFLSTK